MLKIYRIKDTVTGKYLSKRRMSYDDLTFSKRGRVYTGLQYLRDSARSLKKDLCIYGRVDLFPCLADRKGYYKRNSYNEYITQWHYDLEVARKWYHSGMKYPDRFVVEDENETVIGTLEEVMK